MKQPVPAGGFREMVRLALPLILSSSFMTLQITLDRILLSQSSTDAVAAAMPAALLYWTILALLQNTASYATTFVAQYTGAKRPQRVGPAVWQALYFSVVAGLLFLLLIPVAPMIMEMGGHSPAVQELEVIYFQYLSWAALPALIVAAVNSFFAGRGDSWTVLKVDALGLAINGIMVYTLIPGHFGFPKMGIRAPGLATAVGSSCSALLALWYFLRPRYREQFCTTSGWRFDADLFKRLMRFGLPNGCQWMLEGLAFTVFLFLVGRLGDTQLAATNVAFSINFVAIVPMLGMGQAVMILVGQRLGEDRPDLAEMSTWTGFKAAWVYMGALALCYAVFPEPFLLLFASNDPKWPETAALVPALLKFVALYSLFDSMNLIFSFALRGAGDTRFVTVVCLTLAWPMMVVPTWAAYYYDWGLNWAWVAATTYIITQAIVFLLRFRQGKWRSMRVIEQNPVVGDLQTPAAVEHVG
ncbi:MATE family efflux transporter [soil metagenome]